jgi:hypothetical protein
MKVLGFALLLAGAFLGLAAAARAADPEFQKLASLAGHWIGTGPGGVAANVSYELTGGGSTLIETIQTAGFPTTSTVYHSDGTATQATHYCSLVNQPHVARQATRSQAAAKGYNAVRFDFTGPANLVAAADRMTYVKFQWVDANHVNAEWGLRTKGRETPQPYKLTRVR